MLMENSSTLSDEMLEQLRLLNRERGGTLNWTQIVKRHGLMLTGDALRKRVCRYEKRQYGMICPPDSSSGSRTSAMHLPASDSLVFGTDYDSSITPEKYYRLQMENLHLKRVLQDRGDAVDSDELMYDPYPAHLDDTRQWNDWLRSFSARTEVATVMVLSDIHLPDESEAALELAFKIVGEIKPDILLYNGDIFDFDALSTFASKRYRRTKDAIKEVEERWHRIVDRVLESSPETVMVAYRGNHDDRVDRWNTMANNPFADSTEELFVNMVRSGGRVFWLGPNQETNIGAWYVQHGRRVGENAAKNALKDLGWTAAQTQGHAHTVSTWVHRANKANGDYQVVMSACSGALCNIPPHYIQDTKMSRWLHGLVVGHVFFGNENPDFENLIFTNVNLQNLVFHRRNDGILWTVFGNKVLTSDPVRTKLAP